MANVTQGDLFSITPSDTADLAQLAVKIYVGGTGAIKVGTEAGTAITLAAVPVGVLDLGVRIKKVYATGTAATSLIGITGAQ